MRRIPPLLLALGLIALIATPAHAKKYPEPSIYPISWQLDFKHGPIKRIVVGTTAYLYLPYTVTNNTGEEQVWRPDFEMLTKDAKVIRSDRDIPAEVFDQVKARERNKFLEPMTKIAGPLHEGPDQAKDGVAIWKEPDARMGKFSIFVGGLSGEFVELKDEDGKVVMDKENLPVMLRKTLQLNFEVWGDEYRPDRHDVHEGEQKWVMR